MSTAALKVVDLHIQYAQGKAVNGISLHAMPGEVIALVGPEGSGCRSTLLAISGLSRDCLSGSIQTIGKETLHNSTPDICHLGLDPTLETHLVEEHLTCEENLLIPLGDQGSLNSGLTLGLIYDIYPCLANRQDDLVIQLSASERRLLALARILRSGATVVLLNDITTDMPPHLQAVLTALIQALKTMRYTVLLAEQNLDFCAPITDRYYVLDGGYIIDHFAAMDLPHKLDNLTALLNRHTGSPQP